MSLTCRSWGRNDHGQLGLGHCNDTFTPTVSINGADHSEDCISVSCGDMHSAVVRFKPAQGDEQEDLNLWVCGKSEDGRLGLGFPMPTNILEEANKGFTSNPQNQEWPCLVRFVQHPFFVGKLDVQSVSCGLDHTAVAAATGELYVFGKGNNYQLGTGKGKRNMDGTWPDQLASAHTPQLVDFSISDDRRESTATAADQKQFVMQVSCGYSHNIVVMKSMKAYTWGRASIFSGLGYDVDQIDAVANIPTDNRANMDEDPSEGNFWKLPTEARLLEVAAGLDHMCVVANTAQGVRLYARGVCAAGQLGIGTTALNHGHGTGKNKLIRTKSIMKNTSKKRQDKKEGVHTVVEESIEPIETVGFQRDFILVPFSVTTEVSFVACGWNYSIIGDTAGNLYSFGTGHCGQLGLGPGVTQTKSPAHITSLRNIRSVDASFVHSAACDTKGQLYTWGEDGAQIDASYGHVLPECRGLLGRGELAGDDRTVWEPQRVQVQDGMLIQQVSLGMAHALAVTQNGEILSWGYGYFAVLGNGFMPNGEPIRSNNLVPKVVKCNSKVQSVAAGLIHSCALDTKGELRVGRSCPASIANSVR